MRSRELAEKAVAKVALYPLLALTPRPAVRVYRRGYDAGGAQTAARLDRYSPSGVVEETDVGYGAGPDETLDVYRPEGARQPLPAVVWIHGGSWFAGSKEEAAGYYRLLASHSYTVVVPEYSKSPRHRYPTPTRQLMHALAHIQREGEPLLVDGARIVLCGDSAGAHIAAQVALLATNPEYARLVGIAPTVTGDQLCGVVLACGAYDMSMFQGPHLDPHFLRQQRVIWWAHTGHRDFLTDPWCATMALVDHLTPDFPAALITAGNGDVLEPRSVELVERLEALGARPETVFFDADHRPVVPHQYQFELDTEAAQLFLGRLLAFLQRQVAR